jgi:uncharacterized protein DUF4242
MPEFLVELYNAREDCGTLERSTKRAQQVAELLSSDGTPIRYLRSIFVPEDETCFLLYEAASAETVFAAVMQAQLTFERVIETFTPGGQP